MAGPPCERNVHDTQHNVQAPQRPVLLTRGARAIAIAIESFDMTTGFFLGGIVEADPDDLACGDKLDRETDHGPPQLPASVVERAPEEDVEP